MRSAQIERLADSPTSPTIDPAGLNTPPFTVSGDEDWYVFRPKFTTDYQVRILFHRIVALANGRPGLPGTGDLSLDIYDANGGRLIVSGVADGSGDNRTAICGANAHRGTVRHDLYPRRRRRSATRRPRSISTTSTTSPH